MVSSLYLITSSCRCCALMCIPRCPEARLIRQPVITPGVWLLL